MINNNFNIQDYQERNKSERISSISNLDNKIVSLIGNEKTVFLDNFQIRFKKMQINIPFSKSLNATYFKCSDPEAKIGDFKQVLFNDVQYIFSSSLKLKNITPEFYDPFFKDYEYTLKFALGGYKPQDAKFSDTMSTRYFLDTEPNESDSDDEDPLMGIIVEIDEKSSTPFNTHFSMPIIF